MLLKKSGRGVFRPPLPHHQNVRFSHSAVPHEALEVLYAPLQVIAILFTILHAVCMADISFLRIGLMLLLRLYPTSVILLS